MSSEHRLRYDQLGAELLQAVEIARHVHQRHIRGDIGHGNLASLRRGRRIIVLREILDGRIGRLLRYLLARRQDIGSRRSSFAAPDRRNRNRSPMRWLSIPPGSSAPPCRPAAAPRLGSPAKGRAPLTSKTSPPHPSPVPDHTPPLHP